MDKEEAKIALARLNYKIANNRKIIAGLEQNKQAIKVVIKTISTSKKSRMVHLQNDINRTRTPQQKTRKRETRDREKKTFDGRIHSKKKEIENIDTKIVNKRKEISGWVKIKKAIKLDQTNKNSPLT